MKKLTLSLSILVILCVGFYFLGLKMSYKSPVKPVGTARLIEDGSMVKIALGQMKGELGSVFLFLDNQNNIINTLSVENSNIAGPSYRIVKGNKHDWLVITTIGTNGTGYMEYVDTWYLVTSTYGGIQKVLSYNSKVTEVDTSRSKVVTTEVVSDGTDDNILDIRFNTKSCTEKNICDTSFQIKHYVWNLDKFVLSPNP